MSDKKSKVKLAELVAYLPNFKAFMAVPKPKASTVWELSVAYSSEIEPAVKAYNEAVQALAKQLGVDKAFEDTVEGETSAQKKKRTEDRISANQEFVAKVDELGEKQVQISISKIDGKSFAEFIDDYNAKEKEKENGNPVVLTLELMVPWLFK